MRKIQTNHRVTGDGSWAKKKTTTTWTDSLLKWKRSKVKLILFSLKMTFWKSCTKDKQIL